MDTAVEPRGEGRFAAQLSQDWEIWGPNGGYLAGIALRAAAASSAQPVPASLTCHHLSVASFDPVELEVVSLRATRRAESLRVTMWQQDKRIVESLVWLVTPGDGLLHDADTPPDVADPDALPSLPELLGAERRNPPSYRFWDNFEARPLDWNGPFEQRPAGEPRVRNWYRYTPTATFDDPVVDAIRSLILLDTMSWPAARRAHPPGPLPYVAPTLDVAVQFHRAAPASEWLLVEGVAPVAEQGLAAYSAKVWSRDRRLLASAAGQMLCRPVPG
ncbi:MAG TPA: thioesterase family protein [Egibacteraceae bacterium]|nr:thioesterase family protein [Egibacteraceae bacterium]